MPGDYALVLREVPRSLVLACPDGCGDILTINLDPRADAAWHCYDAQDDISLYPSIWREDGCGAHFIIWQGQVLWCRWDRASESGKAGRNLTRRVLEALSAEHFIDFPALAADINADPWEVLWTCRQLVRQRKAAEGERLGTFGCTLALQRRRRSGSSG
jgi:hypothetical protein